MCATATANVSNGKGRYWRIIMLSEATTDIRCEQTQADAVAYLLTLFVHMLLSIICCIIRMPPEKSGNFTDITECYRLLNNWCPAYPQEIRNSIMYNRTFKC